MALRSLKMRHDPPSPDGAPCTSKCRVISRRLEPSTTVAGVKYLQLTHFERKVHKPSQHGFEGQHHFEENFTCKDAPIGTLVLRHLVGIVRLSQHMATEHGIGVVYHIGFQRGTAGSHHDGRAIDVGGFALTPPALKGTTKVSPPRIGDDFHIALH